MTFVWRAALIMCVIFAGCIVGILLQHLLPTQHIADAKSAITTIQGLVGLLLALVLSRFDWSGQRSSFVIPSYEVIRGWSMAGKSPVLATQQQIAGLDSKAVGSDRAEADRARAILLTLRGWTSARL